MTRDNHAKLFDFGLCKELKEGMKNIDGDYLCTQYMGTPRYMSPEVHNKRYYGLPADICSFKMIFRELMSLEMCFKEANSLPELVAIAYGKKCTLPIKKSWQREARRLLQKGLNLYPLMRPNAIEICEDLHFSMRNEITSADGQID
jgi:serine/threonine protein kinase